MKNPLLVPEFREMLAANNVEELQSFCESTPPAVVADFLGAMTPQEVWEILLNISPETRSLIFSSFDEDVRIALLEVLHHDELVDVIANLPDEQRLSFIQELPLDIVKKLNSSLLTLQPAEAAPALKLVDGATAPAEMRIPATIEGVAIYNTINSKLHQIDAIGRHSWINVVNPKQDELSFLSRQFSIPMDFLMASLDIDERARIEVEDDATLIILKIPVFDESNPDILYVTLPIGIILLKDRIITVCAKETDILADFIDNKIKHFSTANVHRFILQIFLRTVLMYLQYLKRIHNASNIIQKKVEQASKNQQLIKLLNIEKSLVYFTTSLKSNQLMLERLQKMKILKMDEENEDLFEDIITESKQAIEMANVYSDILSGMMDAFASIISNNLNIVMKILTLITIILSIPVVFSSLYGMNVKLPFQESPFAFLIVIGSSLVLALIGILIFIRNKWL
jgi:magnesium transporter